MTAHLYICNSTFKWNGTDGFDEFKAKMADFQFMLENIIEHKEDNLLYIYMDSLLSTMLLPNVTFANILDYDYAIKTIGKDCYIILMGMIKHRQPTEATLKDIREYLSYEDEDNCHGIVVFPKARKRNSHIQVMSTVEGWLNFRRHYLGKYPKNAQFFLGELNKFFPALRIHPNSRQTIKEVLDSHSLRIVECLSALNDYFIEEFMNCGMDIVHFLPHFAGSHSIDDASLEGNKDDRFKFTFDENGVTTTAYCEAHLKMYRDNSNNAAQHCRIYFRKPEPGDSVVYVGYIGRHL